MGGKSMQLPLELEDDCWKIGYFLPRAACKILSSFTLIWTGDGFIGSVTYLCSSQVSAISLGGVYVVICL